MAKEKGKRLNLYAKDYVVFDLETTGLSPEADEIIEISGIRVREGKAAEEFSTLVNPGRPIPYAASRVNGITDRMVQDAPVLKDALERFLDFAGKDILVGHNIHTFDMLFLYNGAARVLKRAVPNDYVDTLYMARGCLPGLYRYRLTDLAAHFGIDTKGAHRALKDCDMNRQCYECMGKLLEKRTGQDGVGSGAGREIGQNGMGAAGTEAEAVCPKCGGILVKRKGKFGAFWGCSAYPGCRYTRNA
ncbi:MAG: DNA polymerase III subunit epsilon [Lachnospiraceae bacterium]|nr:DNA polymerase III subunit epsilon [Lachnospiraceae bacterium]